jgi:hypothetical protein
MNAYTEHQKKAVLAVLKCKTCGSEEDALQAAATISALIKPPLPTSEHQSAAALVVTVAILSLSFRNRFVSKTKSS